MTGTPSLHGPRTRVDVLGTHLNPVTSGQAADEIGRWVDGGRRSYVCVAGVRAVMESVRDPRLRAIRNGSGLTVPDGRILARACRTAGVSAFEPLSGLDLVLAILARAAERGWSSYFYGDFAGALDAGPLGDGRFSGMRIAGAHAPSGSRPPTAAEDAEAVRRINGSGADLVWVGLPSPVQERWTAEHRERLGAAALLGVGEVRGLRAARRPQTPERAGSVGRESAYGAGGAGGAGTVAAVPVRPVRLSGPHGAPPAAAGPTGFRPDRRDTASLRVPRLRLLRSGAPPAFRAPGPWGGPCAAGPARRLPW